MRAGRADGEDLSVDPGEEDRLAEGVAEQHPALGHGRVCDAECEVGALK
jgi:hypothetical protein